MSLAIINSRALLGLNSPPVSVEVHLSRGLPRMHVVGLPEKCVKESQDRVRSAIINSGYRFPSQLIVINLAPAELPKSGGQFDLAIAIGILAAQGLVPQQSYQSCVFVGELALSGQLRPIQGSLPLSLATQKENKELILPAGNKDEAALCKNLILRPAHHLCDVIQHLRGKQIISPYHSVTTKQPFDSPLDMSDVIGQHAAKRALEITAAGQHNFLMVGPPGTGKSMLSKRLNGLLPPLTQEQAIEVAAITSLSVKGFQTKDWQRRPFRSPHHTASSAALVGGGNPPQPGEISLAHHGVLLLDELPEFQKRVLDTLREPLESGCITISRAGYQTEFPARFQCVATMNPCPCGYYGDASGRCRCTEEQVKRYMNRVSGPLLDRFDLHITVPALPPQYLWEDQTIQESSESIQKRILKARQFQQLRHPMANAHLSEKQCKEFCILNKSQQQFLQQAMHKWGISLRGRQRIIKIARTIADLSQSQNINHEHLQEALSYRLYGSIGHP